MSIASRIEAIEQHLTDDYSVLEVAGADLTNVDKNIVNLKLTWQERLLYFINNGTDVVWNNWEKVTGEGETLTLNSTEEAPMKIDLKGNTSQETTTGKNLLPNNQTTQTINGVTFTMNSDKSVTIKGTATANTDYYFVGTSSQYEDFGLTTGTYNFNGCTGGSEQTYMLFTVMNRNGNIYYYSSTTGGRQMVVETGDTFRIFIRVISGTTVNKTIYPQINVGSTPLSYEPYTGGQASPNPQYPQDIHVVSGDNSINVCGKNLVNYDNNTNLENKYLNASGSFESAIYTYVNGTIKANSNKITISFNNSVGQGYVRIGEYKEDGTFIKRTLVSTTPTTLTLDSNTSYLIYSIDKNSDNYFEKLQLEKNNTKTNFEPYSANSYNIDLPVENLFDKDNANYVNGWIDGTTMRLNTINGNRMFYMPCKPNTTYTISRSVITSSFRTITYNSTPFPTVTSSNVDYTVGSVLKNDNGTTLTITTNANAKYLVVHYGKIEDTNLNESLATIQVEYGSKQNSYTPYGTTPIELCKIGDYQDSIKKSTGKNLCNGINQNVYLNNATNQCGVADNNSGLYIQVSGGNYTISTTKTQERYRVACSNNEPSGVAQTAYVGKNKDNTSNSITIDTTGYSYLIVNATDLSAIQIEKGSSSSSFEPYGKVWYLNKQIGKVVFDGTEDWGSASSIVSGTSRFVYQNNNIFNSKIEGDRKIYVVSYSFKGISWQDMYFDNHTTKNAISNYTASNVTVGRIHIRIDNTIANNVSTFKTWLSTHNTTVYYVLATPTYTEITDSTLISQLEALNGSKSYTIQTNINQVNNDLPFILDVTALKQLIQ